MYSGPRGVARMASYPAVRGGARVGPSRRDVFGDFAGNAQRLSGEPVIFDCKRFDRSEHGAHAGAVFVHRPFVPLLFTMLVFCQTSFVIWKEI
jgi:hypothetical protein